MYYQQMIGQKEIYAEAIKLVKEMEFKKVCLHAEDKVFE